MAVFVSYDGRDRNAVINLIEDLRDADEQVWLDRRLAGGDAWWCGILEHIRGCDVFIFVLSENSIDSDLCKSELGYALDLGLPILLVLIGSVDGRWLDLPATAQIVYYRTPTAGMQLLSALDLARTQRQPLASPLPREPGIPERRYAVDPDQRDRYAVDLNVYPSAYAETHYGEGCGISLAPAPVRPTPTLESVLESVRANTRAHVARSAHPERRETRQPSREPDFVDCSVFAPPVMSPGSSALVQVFVHLSTQSKSVGRTARQYDQLARRRGVHTLEAPILRGERLTFELAIPGIEVPEPVQQLPWLGDPASAQFEAVIPSDLPIGHSTVGTLTVSRRGVPIGWVKFSIQIEAGAGGTLHEIVGDEAKRYKRAFVSYASQDRAEVIARIQMLRVLGIEYFQDIDMDPGQRWERELYRQIDGCDLFLLFWSQAAKDSNWVHREVQYALGLGKRVPDIRPIVIEGPPVPLPWDELAHLHFNDRLLSLLAVAARNPPPRPDPLEQLKKLAELRDAGALTDDEFQTKKAEILTRI